LAKATPPAARRPCPRCDKKRLAADAVFGIVKKSHGPALAQPPAAEMSFMRRTCLPMLLLLLLVPLTAHAGANDPPDGDALFEAKIRPILTTHCVQCHGPKKQSGGLRLDARASALATTDRGTIVVPGAPEKSVLIHAVRQTGELKMPPKGKLPTDAIDALALWIKLGARWPDGKAGTASDPATLAWKTHWAFQPVRKPALPPTRDSQWPGTPIDRFILAKLEDRGLRPSAPADRRVLIRRVTFDLIGLPPTPEEVQAFVADTSASAYEKVIDRLLSSPHYGERWGRYWLDVARYADTKGYVFFEENNFPWAWTYRDYVIRAFNDDLPYDRFLMEQLAADRLALGEDRQPLTALGFLSLGGRFMNNVHDIIDDRIDVVTRGLMGLTVGCARCHDHKYDPISQQDYYALYGVFASSTEPTIPPLFQPAPATEQYAKFHKELKAREQKLTDFVKAKHAELIAGARQRVAEYLLAAHAQRDQPSTDDFMLIADTNDLNPTMIVRWQKYLERTRKTHDPIFAPWHALADLPEENWPARAVPALAKVSGNPLICRALTDHPPKKLTDVAQQYATVLHAVEKKCKESKQVPLPDAAEEQLRLVFHGPDAPPNVALLPYGDLSLLPDRASQSKLQELRKALEKWRATGPGAPPRAMVLEDLETPLDPYVFLRGNPSNRGDTVPRRLPRLLAGAQPQPFTHGSGRLELARAIASRDNPLTARVIVNRLWQYHFGRGLVTTPSDFGLRSEPPSHPELLDWLAARFMADGWSLKRMHKQMLLSSAYQQASDDRPDGRAADPDNRLLWKMSRQRLDFEATRDALLAVAGKLDRAIGGPSVQSPMAPTATRRTLYSFLDRLNMPGLFRTFDFPSPDATSPQRDNTTIAPQALFLMNHPLVMECARNVLRRPEIAAEKDAATRIERVYQLLFGRPPAAAEVALSCAYVSTGSDRQLAWERYVHALLQSNEFAWVD
jgi:mono/diheme cytochrome c family protein